LCKDRTIESPRKWFSALAGKGLIMGSLYFLLYAGNGAWLPFLGVYFKQLGFTGLQIGTISGVGAAMRIVSQPIWGVVADLWGRRRSLLVVLLSMALVVASAAWQGGWWFFILWSAVYAVVSGSSGSLINSLTLDFQDEDRALSYDRLRLWGSVGWAVVTFSVGRLITGRDMRLIFLFGAFVYFVAWFLVWRGLEKANGKVALKTDWSGLGRVLKNKRLLLFLVLIVLVRVGESSIFTFVPIFMDDLGGTDRQIGLASSVQALAEIPVFLAATAIILRIGTGRALFLTTLFLSIRTLLYSLVSQPGLIVWIQLLQGMFGLFLVASVEHVNRLVPAEWRATGQSLFWMAYFSAGSIVGNSLSGYLYDQIGPRGMFRVSSAILLVVSLAMLIALRGPPRSEGG